MCLETKYRAVPRCAKHYCIRGQCRNLRHTNCADCQTAPETPAIDEHQTATAIAMRDPSQTKIKDAEKMEQRLHSVVDKLAASLMADKEKVVKGVLAAYGITIGITPQDEINRRFKITQDRRGVEHFYVDGELAIDFYPPIFKQNQSQGLGNFAEAETTYQIYPSFTKANTQEGSP